MRCSSALVLVPRTPLSMPDGGENMIPLRDFDMLQTRSANDTVMHVLEPASLKHVGIWAYFAIGFIVIAVSTVLSYVIYTCCSKAQQRNYYGDDTRASRRIGAARINSIGLQDINYPRDSHPSGKTYGSTLQVFSKAGSGNEKHSVEGDADVQGNYSHAMQELSFKDDEGNHNPSDSSQKYPKPYSDESPIWNSPFSNGRDTSFESEGHWLSSPPLAKIHDKPGHNASFQLPPPPSSPTAAHKEFRQRYRGSIDYLSPPSPSPSYFVHGSPPDITLESIAGAAHRPSLGIRTRARDSLLLFAGEGAGSSRTHAGEFDSHNIRFVTPQNPFNTPTNALRWNDPKLSPIGGAIISHSPSTHLSPVTEHMEYSPFSRYTPPRGQAGTVLPVTPVYNAVTRI